MVEVLRREGHDVSSMAEIRPSSTDAEVLDLANREKRVLLTNDKDFGELVYLQGKSSSGIILLRVQSEQTLDKISLLLRALKMPALALTESFTVISEDRVRVRPLKRLP